MVRAKALILLGAVQVTPMSVSTYIQAARTHVERQPDTGGLVVEAIPFTRAEDGSNERTRAVFRLEDNQIVLSMSVEPASSYGSPPHPPLLNLRTRYANAGSFSGQTALGIRARVQKRRDRSDAIALVGAPETDLAPSIAGVPPIRLDHYRAELPLGSVTAANVEAVVEGTIAKLPTGRTVDCEDRFFEGSLATPVEVREQRCWLGTNVSRIAFRVRSTGKVIKEWIR